MQNNLTRRYTDNGNIQHKVRLHAIESSKENSVAEDDISEYRTLFLRKFIASIPRRSISEKYRFYIVNLTLLYSFRDCSSS